MSSDHRAFAAELRADALTLRIMMESLELRAAEQDRLAEVADIEREAVAGNVVVAGGISLRSARAAQVYSEDRHDFRGIGHIGRSHAPEPVFR